MPDNRWNFAAAALAAAIAIAGPAAAAEKRPNIVLIVADDMGFSDLGSFGGEIRTPHLDDLAKSGVRLTDFHAAPTCSPTRSMLLTGTDNHTAGVGAMAETATLPGMPDLRSQWGYEGVLMPRVATLAERLKDAGYYTTMAGKWHLGLAPEQNPHARGFSSSFALLQGASNHFGGGFGPDSSPYLRATYTLNGKEVSLPADFYSSDYFTSRIIDQLENRPENIPFFAYLAFTAPHSPLQAPAEDIARYKGRYDKGWAALREERLGRMKALGIIPSDVAAAPLVPDADAWDKLTHDQKRIEVRKMEIYAAMVDRMDQNVGRLVASLKREGTYENTIFLFLSDNGAAPETGEFFGVMPGMAAFLESRDSSYAGMGGKESSVFYGPYWAQAATAPSRLYKGTVAEGGIRVPAFITYSGFKRQGGVGSAYANVMDVLPTLMDATSTDAASAADDDRAALVRGRSMLPYLLGNEDSIHAPTEAISLELFGQRAVRQGQWKLTWLAPQGATPDWALYDLSADPAEQHNLSQDHPELRDMLIAAWERYAEEARIITDPKPAD